MTVHIYLNTLPWVIACYPWVTGSSAVPISPRWPRPPVVTCVPAVPPWALTSLTGIGHLLTVLADITRLRGMARNNNYVYLSYIISCMYIMITLHVLSPCIIPAAMPQPDYDDLYHYCNSVSRL